MTFGKRPAACAAVLASGRRGQRSADRRRPARILLEFRGVREDVTDIVLNIKAICHPHGRRGAQAYDTAQDRSRDSHGRRHQNTVGDVEILNPELRAVHSRRGRRDPDGIYPSIPARVMFRRNATVPRTPRSALIPVDSLYRGGGPVAQGSPPYRVGEYPRGVRSSTTTS